MEISAPAKVNLTLDIIKKRPDGYHDLLMVVHQVPVYDKVIIEASGQIKISCSRAYIPCDSRNLAHKAATLFFSYEGISGGADIYLEKNIPSGAGLGGGSSDAAAVITALNEIYGTKYSKQTLMEIGTAVGADVPFFIEGGACLAEGIGERLTPVPKLPPCYMVLAKPKFSVSTVWAYKNFDFSAVTVRPDTNAVIAALKSGDLKVICENLVNVMETAVIDKYPLIAKYKNIMLKGGALGSAMSGSGSAVFGLFDHKEKAEKCRGELEKTAEEAWCLSL